MPDRVLIIEDSQAFAQLLQKLIFDTHSLKCDVAANYAAAEELIAKNAEHYFSAIVDLNLPDAPTGAATKLVVEHDIPALIFTSSSDQALKEDLWESGISDYAHKSGPHSLEYMAWIIGRLRKNDKVEILVVDDSAVSRQTMSKILHSQRFKVHLAKSGEEGLQMLQKHPNVTTAIVDAHMGGMTGFELASKFRETHDSACLEILGVSSKGGASTSVQFIKSGANDFLLKPFTREEFLCRINRGVERIETFKELQALNQTKNQLIGTAAHDIRGPLGAIKTATDYLLEQSPPPERQTKMLNMIQKSSTHLLALLSDLLDSSAIEGGEIQLNYSSANLSEILLDRVELYQTKAEEKAIKIQYAMQENVVFDFDSIKIVQLFDNLLTNALKYTPPGGEVLVGLERSDQRCIFYVEDSGPGVAEADRALLFDAYERLSSKVTGGEKATGLGLAIAKKITDAHKGKIEYLASALGGSGFRVNLPLKIPDQNE